jgi:hypothetical protein
MDPRPAASPEPDPEAVEFIRFCYQRRRVGWPELYDEMCAVAARGLFRGYGSDDLAGFGIGFSLFEMPSLAAMSAKVVAEEQARRRPMSVLLRTDVPGIAAEGPEVPVVALATEVFVQVPIAPSAVVPASAEAMPVMTETELPVAPQVRLRLVPGQA